MFQNLMKNKTLADRMPYPDQDMLNKCFANQWTPLPDYYHHMYLRLSPSSPLYQPDGRTIAIHEKIHILQREFPESHWLWNNHSYVVP